MKSARDCCDFGGFLDPESWDGDLKVCHAIVDQYGPAIEEFVQSSKFFTALAQAFLKELT